MKWIHIVAKTRGGPVWFPSADCVSEELSAVIIHVVSLDYAIMNIFFFDI